MARQAVALLNEAGSHGLESADYGAQPLRQALLDAENGLVAPRAQRLGQALESGMLRYLADVHGGRIDPRTLHHNFRRQRPDAFDPLAVLTTAANQHDLTLAVRAAVPQLPQYEHLRQALLRYRQLEPSAAWAQPLPPPGAARKGVSGPGKLEPGQPYDGLALLASRLELLGDLPSGQPLPERYEGAIVEAVRQFQLRHGLQTDGVLGRATLHQLAVEPQARARQIELALERLRWTPLLQARRMVVVNLPEFMLRAYEVAPDGRVHVMQEMRVVVGKAMDTRTPLFDEDMRFIEFSPYWNVPPSIARKELVPKLRHQPGYFHEQGFEFVAGDGRVHTHLSTDLLNATLAGQAHIRQRPGPKNALGDIKFVFPNRDNIYLHHTPATALFTRDRRDFSHGCIRVEKPLDLALFVLQDQAEWTAERIQAAMDKGESSTLRLKQPVPVLIAYGTTLVKNGLIHFYDDIYGLDRVLDTALRARPHPPAVPQDLP